jgi:tetratricopeptide (TPR) repeat protein
MPDATRGCAGRGSFSATIDGGSPNHLWESGMPVRKLVRAWAGLALSGCIFCALSSRSVAQKAPACQGPAELEQALQSHPSAGAYDALGAYFGRQQKLSCAISAFESALRLEPNSWEARFNLSLALRANKRARGSGTSDCDPFATRQSFGPHRIGSRARPVKSERHRHC